MDLCSLHTCWQKYVQIFQILGTLRVENPLPPFQLYRKNSITLLYFISAQMVPVREVRATERVARRAG
jgi:hypothetical protein